MSSISQPSMPRSLFKQLYCEMFAFSAFGQGPHTEYYFIHQGDEGSGGVWGGEGGFWKRLRFERLLFLITARVFLKWIKYCNLAYTIYAHTNRVLPILQLTLKSCELPAEGRTCLQKGCTNLKPLLGPNV